MNTVLKRNNKRKAFTLVELMLLLVVLSLVIASSYSLITRRHRLVPRRSVHGQYACFRQAVEQDGSITYQNHELLISGNTVIADNPDVERCSFTFPRTASYVFMQIIGGGGAGGNANHNITTGYNTYNHRTYDRQINLVEPEWDWRETKNHSSGEDRFSPKHGSYVQGLTDTSTGSNRSSSIISWGGTTVVAPDGKIHTYDANSNVQSSTNLTDSAGNTLYYDTRYPQVSLSHSACTDATKCLNEDTDQYSPAWSNSPRRGLTRASVDKHFKFRVKEQVPNTETKGAFNELLRQSTLFDSNLFQYLVRKYVVAAQFAYDQAGTGPTSPGVKVVPLLPSYTCRNYSSNQTITNSSFSECLVTTYNYNKLGAAYNSSARTAARNKWCSIPIDTFARASRDGKKVCLTTGACSDGYRLTTAETSYINSNKDIIGASCPIIHYYYNKDAAGAENGENCYGGTGGLGSYFTSDLHPFSYEFFPVVGIRWEPSHFLNPQYTGGNFLSYYKSGNIDNAEVPGDKWAIDYSGYKTVEGSTISVNHRAVYGDPPEDQYSSYLYEPNSPNSTYQGQLKACSDPVSHTNCINVNGTWYDKAQDYTGNYVDTPLFTTPPNLSAKLQFNDPEPPVMKDWNYLTGGYPYGFANSQGFNIGVGQIYEYINEEGNRVKKTNPLALACIAPGVMAFNNKHQRNNTATVDNNDDIYNSSYIPIKKGNPVSDINDPTGASVNISSLDKLWLYFRTITHYNKNFQWLYDLTNTTSTNNTSLEPRNQYNYDNFNDRYDPWIGCFGSNCVDSSKYFNEALGMKECSPGTDCYNKIFAGTSHHSSRADLIEKCNNVPLKTTYDYADDSEGKPTKIAIPKAFGSPGTQQIVPEVDLADTETLKYGILYKNSGEWAGSCPTARGKGSSGNSVFNYGGYGTYNETTGAADGRLAFVGRTGFILRSTYPKWNSSDFAAYDSANTWVKNYVLSAPSGTSKPNRTVTLANEGSFGIALRLHYYTHALSYGTPGKSGEYRTIFARSFTNSFIYVEPGDGGQRIPINPRETDYEGAPGRYNVIPNPGTATVVYYNCDSTGIVDMDHCKDRIVAHGGEGGKSSQVDPPEWANLHQDPSFIKQALAKFASIRAHGFRDNGGEASDDPEQFNIFPHCSLQAPRPTPENIAKYTHPATGKTLIDSTCFGNGGTEADESDFAANISLFDLSSLSNLNIEDDVTKVGKGGDGGFVRDDCWVTPQYFEIRGLFTKSNSYDATVANASNTGNTAMSYDLVDLNTNNPAAARTNWGILPNFEIGSSGHSPIYQLLGGDNLPDDIKTQLDLAGYTRILPQQILGGTYSNPDNNTCRRRPSRYTGKSNNYKHTGNSDSIVGNTTGDSYYYNETEEVGVRSYGSSNANGTGTLFATEIQGTEGQPGGVFITW